jgi:hypothetical protein
MLDKFRNRDFELKILKERHGSNKPEFLVIYGKRRIGKTELVKQAFKDIKYIYLLADRRSDFDILRDFSKRIGKFFDDVGVSMVGIRNWTELFGYLEKKIGNERIVMVVDEFPFLVSGNRAIPSLFQKGWDEYLQHTNLFLILMGSSISMMEKEVLYYKSPLYGRRTGQLLLHPLKFKDARKFFPKKSMEEQIEFYSILGGTPAYLLQFTEDKSLAKNIKERVLRRDAFLYNEVEFILREELKEPRQYFTILKEISFGRNRVNELSQATNIERSILSRYLSILESLRVIRREIPVTEKHPHKSRKGIYKIEDNFFRFWFEFIFPYRGDIERDEMATIIQRIEEQLPQFVSYVFEDVCKEVLWELLKKEKMPLTFTKIGKWWYKDNEIDIIALNDETRDALFAECKWQGKKVDTKVIENLMGKSKLVEWNNDIRKEHFAMFSKSGFTNSCLDRCKEKGVMTFDLKDIENILGG